MDAVERIVIEKLKFDNGDMSKLMSFLDIFGLSRLRLKDQDLSFFSGSVFFKLKGEA